MKDWKKKKVAVLLRRSQGETGTTKEQLERIMPIILDLEKKGKIKKLNRGIVGKDIEGKKRFKRSRDLMLKGDFFNEGRGTSAGAFKPDERPVLMELLKRMKLGQYEAVIAENMDRYSRDPLSFAAVALDLWRDDNKIFWGLADNEGWGAQLSPHEESIIVTKLMWGGEAKKAEARKARKSLAKAIYRGSITGSKPEWLGSKSKTHGLDYRKAWDEMNMVGHNEDGNLNESTRIGKLFNKDNKWANLWYQKMRRYNQLKVLGEWLDGIDKVNNFIRLENVQPRVAFKQTPVKNILNSTKGFFAYPAGVLIANTNDFVVFPNPNDLDFEQLAIHKDASTIPDFEVEVTELGDSQFDLNIAQTQPRAKKR